MATVEEEESGATRPPRKRKAERRKEERPEPGYAVGQVAGSLRGSEGGAGPLAALFGGGGGSPAPLYAPAPPAPQQAPAPPHKDPAPQPPPPKKARGAPPAAAASEARVCAREQGLERADRQEAEEARARRRGRRAEPRPRLSPAEERLRERRTVFVGNLPAALSKGALRGLFRGCGAIESVRFRSVARAEPALSRRVAAIQRRLPPGRRSLQAYVVFREEAAAGRALARNGAPVPGSGLNMRVDRAAGAPHDARRSAFVGNLPYGLEEQALREHFGPCGPVEAARVVRDRETGLGKGFGYVLFADADGAQLALRLDGSELLGRRLRVKRCLQLGGPAAAAGGASGPGSSFAGCRHSRDSEGKRGSAGWRQSQDYSAGKKKRAGSRRPQDSGRTEGKMQPAKRKVSTQLGGTKPTKQRFPRKNNSQPALVLQGTKNRSTSGGSSSGL